MWGYIIIIFIIFFIWFTIKNNKRTSDNPDEIIFLSSFSRGGSLIVPERLTFDSDKVTWKKNYGIDSLYTNTITRTIPHKNIVGINVHRNIIGCNIEIIGHGIQSIYARNFKNEDAFEIESLVNRILIGNQKRKDKDE